MNRPAIILVGVAALAAAACIALFFPVTLGAYLAAFIFAGALPLGSAALLMLHNLTAGAWGDAIRPTLCSLARTAPVLPLIFVPVLVRRIDLYPDATSLGFRRDFPGIESTPGFFFAAGIGVLVLWAVAAPWIGSRTRHDGERLSSLDQPGLRRVSLVLRGLSAIGLIVYVLSVTIAADAWIGELQPRWHSSMLGLMVVTSQALIALALSIMLAPAHTAAPTPSARADLGSLLFTFALLHAYMSFSQFLIIWCGGIPERTSWFVARSTPGALVAIIAVTLLMFLLPCAAMLFRNTKRSPLRSRLVAVGSLGGALIEAAWLVLPSAPTTSTWSAPIYVLLTILVCAGVLLLGIAAPRAISLSHQRSGA